MAGTAPISRRTARSSIPGARAISIMSRANTAKWTCFLWGRTSRPAGRVRQRMSAAGNPESGVTLLEALVVIAIMAMVAALVAPNIGASMDLLSLRQSARVLQADLRV